MRDRQRYLNIESIFWLISCWNRRTELIICILNTMRKQLDSWNQFSRALDCREVKAWGFVHTCTLHPSILQIGLPGFLCTKIVAMSNYFCFSLLTKHKYIVQTGFNGHILQLRAKGLLFGNVFVISAVAAHSWPGSVCWWIVRAVNWILTILRTIKWQSNNIELPFLKQNILISLIRIIFSIHLILLSPSCLLFSQFTPLFIDGEVIGDVFLTTQYATHTEKVSKTTKNAWIMGSA